MAKLEQKEKRVIEITLERKGEVVNVSVTNYFTGELSMSEGLPLTTKAYEPGFHGFGVSSIRMIVKKYGGNLSISAKDGIFTLSFYLINPKE